MKKQAPLCIGIGDFGSQIAEELFEAETIEPKIYACHYKETHLNKIKVSNKIMLNEDLRERDESSIVNHKTFTELFHALPQIVFLMANTDETWSRKALIHLAKKAKHEGHMTIAIIYSETSSSDFYSQWETDPNECINALFIHRDNDSKEKEIQTSTLTDFSAFATDVIKTFTAITDPSAFIRFDTHELSSLLTDCTTPIISEAIANGKNRSLKAIEKAYTDEMIGSRNILLFIQSGKKEEVTMDEIGYMISHLDGLIPNASSIGWGTGIVSELNDEIKIIIITSK